MQSTSRLALIMAILLYGILAAAQQKGQYVPGQAGLNAGVLPEPGFTYQNMTVNYSADSLKDSDGNSVPGITGTFSFWAVENWFIYVPKDKILGGKFAALASVNVVNGSLTADLGDPPRFPLTGGGYGISDTWVQPVTLSWSSKRVDNFVAWGFVAPTGRYSAGASDNVGSGYWGQHFLTGTTFYVTKNKGTSANLFTDWEIHGQKSGTNITPGQAFTDEWGLGQLLPLKKDFSRLLQVGVIGYDQWQVSANGGTRKFGLPASVLPYYSVHAVGAQVNLLLPPKNLVFFFKYENEYLAKARPQGRTIVFGGSWTLRMPKPAAKKP